MACSSVWADADGVPLMTDEGLGCGVVMGSVPGEPAPEVHALSARPIPAARLRKAAARPPVGPDMGRNLEP
jgi:hypothetical protein